MKAAPAIAPRSVRERWRGDRQPAKSFCLASRELLVAQHAGVVQLRELPQLRRQVRPASRGSRRRCGSILRRRRRDLLLLSLRVSYALLISHILLLLRSRLLVRVLLLLMVADSVSGPDDGCSCHGGTDK